MSGEGSSNAVGLLGMRLAFWGAMLTFHRRRDAVIALVLGIAIVAAIGRVGYMIGEWRTAFTMYELLDEDQRADIDALAATYGPSKHSQYQEEWIIRDFFKDERGGVFVDVGANHHQHSSNTYYLETVLGWSGVAIDAQPKFAEGYRDHRPRTAFLPLFVSDVSDQQATLYVTANDMVASSQRDFTEQWGETSSMQVPTSTLDDVLDRLGVQRIDFLSMDIELHEPQALAGFSVERFRPRLVAIEAHPPVRQQILNYFARHGYALLGRYWQADDENFWFAPIESTGDARPLVAGHRH